MNHLEKEAQLLLRNLGINGTYAGFHLAAYGIAIAIENPRLIVHVCKGLYVEIAIHFHISISNVERNIRTIITIIWEKGNRELLNEVFGKQLEERPNNTLFIDSLCQYICTHPVNEPRYH